ncbi:Uncharacterized protein SCF082_LOCUS23615, partial [Durusdinium trenchii]
MTPAQFDLLVKRLILMKTPKVVVMLVLLTWWLDLPKHHDYQTLEFFAGVGRIAAMSQFCGYQSAAVPNESVLELFKNMPWCQEGALWEEEADLRDALIYVRGSKLLKIPEEESNHGDGDEIEDGPEEIASVLQKDAFVKKCKKRVQTIQEQDLWVPGAFMSEEDTQKEGSRIKGIKADCAKNKGWIRLSERAAAIDKELLAVTEQVTGVSTDGIVDGYKRKCADALNLSTRAQCGAQGPFISHIKSQLKKEQREREKEELGQACSCCQAYTYGGGLDFSDPMMQRLNAKNNSYLTHFLLCAFASKRFPNFPGLLMSILGGIAEDLAEICEAGIEYGGSRYWFALLGYKSDLEYAAKTGLLSRSYQNVGHKNEIECCHQCGAGGQQVPFEDFGVRARWKSTVFRSPPWTQLPPFASLSFEPWLSGRAAMWFRHDLFHIFRLGCARNFCASAILLLAYENYFDSDGDSHSLDARLKRAWSNFYLWSCAEG